MEKFTDFCSAFASFIGMKNLAEEIIAFVLITNISFLPSILASEAQMC